MYRFNNILVALDNTDLDAELISATSMIATLSGAKKVKFIHVIKDLNIPSAVQKEFPNLITDALNERKEHIQREIDRYCTLESIEVKLEITTGQATKQIIKYSANEDTDLIIVGRKNEKTGGGVIVSRLARRAGCSLLIIPKGYKKTISKVLVAIDFSTNSLEALNQTIDLLKVDRFPKPQIITQHVYQVPSGYHYTGKSFNEFGKIMEQNAVKQYKKFTKQANTTDLQIKPVFTLERHEDIIGNIYKTAKKLNAGAIIIGAKGITSAAALFIGSSAEKLVQMDYEIPLMVVRSKGKQKGLIDYLKEL